MKLLITGATGMVGSALLQEAIADQEVTSIIALTRRPVECAHPKLTTVIHKDFLDYNSVSSLLANVEVCAWCLGVSQLQVTKEQYHIITYDYTMAAAKAMLAVNPKIQFVFVSGAGADQSGKAKTLFGRVKGKAEKDLMAMPFEKLVIVRPAGIQPSTRNPRAPFIYKLFYGLYPLIKLITPSKVITSQQLAKAILLAAKKGSGKILLDNGQLLGLLTGD